MTTIRLALFIESAGIGGAEKVVLELAKSYCKLFEELLVITLRKGWLTESLAQNGIRHEIISSSSKLDLLLPLKINALLKKHRINVLHTHSVDSSFYGALATVASSIKHIATEHGDVHHPNRKKLLGFKLFCMRLAKTKFCPVSEYTGSRLKSFHIPHFRVCTVKNPIIIEPYLSQSRESIRQSLGIEESYEKYWLWLHVANIRTVKDQKTLIHGFSLGLKQSKIKQRLIIIGDGDRRAELENLCDELNIRQQVDFLGFRTDVNRFLTAADGFILTSLSEALPMALLEAATSGLVILSTNVGGVPEIMKDAHGYMFNPADASGLAHCIARVLSNPEHEAARAEQTAIVVKQLYSVENVSKSYIEHYQQILNN